MKLVLRLCSSLWVTTMIHAMMMRDHMDPLQHVDLYNYNYGNAFKLDGRYSFYYTLPNYLSRSEKRSDSGEVSGSYSFKAPEGEEYEFKYTAGQGGYRVKSSALPVAPEDTPEVKRAKEEFFTAFQKALQMAGDHSYEPSEESYEESDEESYEESSEESYEESDEESDESDESDEYSSEEDSSEEEESSEEDMEMEEEDDDDEEEIENENKDTMESKVKKQDGKEIETKFKKHNTKAKKLLKMRNMKINENKYAKKLLSREEKEKTVSKRLGHYLAYETKTPRYYMPYETEPPRHYRLLETKPSRHSISHETRPPRHYTLHENKPSTHYLSSETKVSSHYMPYDITSYGQRIRKPYPLLYKLN